jgi:nitrate/nitrite transport system ATP-binding protein
MLTNGPQAHIGQILEVPIPRPRERLKVVNHPSYYGLRGEIVYFLNQQKKAKKGQAKAPAIISGNGLEKVNLELGFVPLTDCAPLIVAQEKGFFAKHGLTQVNLNRESSWQTIAEGISSGRLDASQMVAGMPLAMTLGMGGRPSVPIVSAMTLSHNGNAITLSKRFYDRGVRTLKDFKEAIANDITDNHNLGVVFPSSLHNLVLRYWLAAGGIDPDVDVNLIVIPPSQMVANLKTGNLDGYCVGEPWNSWAVAQNIGFVIDTDLELWPQQVEKVLGVTEAWANKYPATHIALVKALLEACEYCDDRRHRQEIAEILSRNEYIGIGAEFIRPGFIEPYDRGTDREPQLTPKYLEFYLDKTNCPDRTKALWILTQMARWGLVPFPRNWFEVVDRVRRVDIYSEAAKQLGLPGFQPERQAFKLFDGTVFNPDNPLQYLNSLTIKRDVEVKEFAFEDLLVAS